MRGADQPRWEPDHRRPVAAARLRTGGGTAQITTVDSTSRGIAVLLGVEHAIETVAQTQPEPAGAAPESFVDSSFVKQLDEGGFYKQLIASQ